MNMRFTERFEGLPMRVQKMPQRFRALPRRMQLVAGIALAIVIGGLGYLVFIGNNSKERTRPPALVITATAKAKDVTVIEHAIGTVVANATVQVTARVTGQLLRAGFQEGQIVRKGDLLFTIDPRPFQASLQQARAQLDKDAAQQRNSLATKERYDRLFAQNAISVQQRDQADATAKSDDATVEADRAAVRMAELNLGYTQIRSPVDGKTGPILIQPGNLVTANATSPLVVVTQIEPVKVSFSLPQADLPRIQARERNGNLVALLDQRVKGGAPLQAPVDFVSNQVSDQTGTIELRATFDNRDHRLVPGQLVDVSVTLDTLKNATVIPREAVNDGPSGRYVYVVTPDNKADIRPVDVLYDDGTTMAVRGRLRPGDRVIRDGQFGVAPGDTVKIADRSAGPAKTR